MSRRNILLILLIATVAGIFVIALVGNNSNKETGAVQTSLVTEEPQEENQPK